MNFYQSHEPGHSMEFIGAAASSKEMWDGQAMNVAQSLGTEALAHPELPWNSVMV